MQQLAVDLADGRALDDIPRHCGDVTVGCSDVAGIVVAVIDSSEKLREEHAALQATIRALEADQARVSDASDEARLLSERAIKRLDEGTGLMRSSLDQIATLLDLVDALGQHVTSFAAAMEQVRRCSQDIDQIAETTNILALNATIEAHRAGNAGRTFAVVANEVKSLANDTRKATDEISRTVDMLGSEAERVIGRIEAGARASVEAKESVARISETISGVAGLVVEVDRQNEQITGVTGAIGDHVRRVQSVLGEFDQAARDNESSLLVAHGRMQELEVTASEMFDTIVRAGLSPEDSRFVDMARAGCVEAVSRAEAALATGALSADALFDQNYLPIERSNPPRFRSRLNAWADANWRELLDSMKRSDPRMVSVVCLDVNGYLPTHLTEFSQPPSGHSDRDTLYCRNGRIFDIAVNRKAARSRADYMLSVYRRDITENDYAVVRSVFVPMEINGRRWGNYQISYRL